jgi:hypothetical protein
MRTLLYKDKNFLEAAHKIIRDQQAFEVVVTGFSVNLLQFVKQFRIFQPFIMPSFWAIYTYATDKQMQPNWAIKGEDLIVSFRASSSGKSFSSNSV